MLVTPSELMNGQGGGNRPVLNINFLSGQLDSRITFTRASTAWYFGSNGLLASASNNAPRFDYGTPGSTTLQGLLIEEARTNEALWSRDLTNAVWTAVTVTVAKTATGIDGAANSASLLTATAGNGTVLQTLTIASEAQCLTAYVRRVTGVGEIDMTLNGGVSWTNITAQINSGGYTRVPTTPLDATLANPVIGFRIVTNGDAINVDVVQLEDALSPTSPIITTSAGVARAADMASISTSSFAFNAGAGALALEFIEEGISLNSGRLVGASPTGFLYDFGPGIGFFDGASVNIHTANMQSAGVPAKAASSWGPSSSAVVLNGGAVAVGGAPTVTTGGAINIAASGGGANPRTDIWARRLRIYNRQLNSGQLQALTR